MSDRRRRRRDEGDRSRRRRRRRSTSSSDSDGGRARKRTRTTTGWDQPAVGAAAPAPPQALAIAASAAQQQSTGPTSDPNVRKLYIGNVPGTLPEQMVENYFMMHAKALRHKLYHKRLKAAQEMDQDTSLVPKPDDNVSPIERVSVTPPEDPTRSGFAFVELDDEDLTTEMLSLNDKPIPLPDGTMVALKVCRPKNYVKPAASSVPSWLKPKGDQIMLPGHIKGRVVLSGIPDTMPRDELRALLETFGELATYEMLTEADGASCTCVVFDFADEANDDKAINALNALDIDDEHVLNVRKVGAGALVLHTADESTGAGLTQEEQELLVMKDLSDLQKGLHQTLQMMSTLAQQGKPKAAVQTGVAVKRPTKVLALLNLFDSEDLENPEAFEMLKHDIETEVMKYGRVVDMIVPKETPVPPEEKRLPEKPVLLQALQTSAAPMMITQAATPTPSLPPGYAFDPNNQALIPVAKVEEESKKIEDANRERLREWNDACDKIALENSKAKKSWEKLVRDPIRNGVGKVFVEFMTSEEAHKAQVALAGRHFDGRTVVTSFIPEEWLNEKDEDEEPAVDQSVEEILRLLEAGDAFNPDEEPEDAEAEAEAEADAFDPDAEPEAEADAKPEAGADAAAEKGAGDDEAAAAPPPPPEEMAFQDPE